MSLLIETGTSLLIQCLQVLAGCLIAYFLFKSLQRKPSLVEALNREKILLVLFASLLGLMLPLGFFGLIPAVIAAYALGFEIWAVTPLLVSNLIFNPLVLFTDLSFSLHTGLYRIGLALAAGILAGFLLIIFKTQWQHIIRIKAAERFLKNAGGENRSPRFSGILNSWFEHFGVFLLLGVILQVLFRKYVFYDLMNLFDIGTLATAFFSFVKGYDITTPLFLLNMTIFDLVMNLCTFSALASFTKLKVTLTWYVYLGLWVFLISVTNLLFLA